MPPPESLGRALRDGAVRAALWATWVAVPASVAVHLTIRDGMPGAAVLFYATPWPLDAAAALVLAFVAVRRRHRLDAVLAAVLTITCTGFYFVNSLRRNAPQTPGALRGVHWNVAHGYWGWPKIAETLVSLDPDVVWLSESDDAPELDDAFRAAFPGRTSVHGGGGFTVVARGEAVVVERARIGPMSRLARTHLVVKGRTFDSFQVDAPSNPFAAKPPLFEKVLTSVRPHLASPLLVLGYFNTPRDSVAFDAWRGPLSHAFETVGNGLDATWPVPLPVLSIDHVWSGGGLAVRTCELPWTWRSDHLPVVFTFDVP